MFQGNICVEWVGWSIERNNRCYYTSMENIHWVFNIFSLIYLRYQADELLFCWAEEFMGFWLSLGRIVGRLIWFFHSLDCLFPWYHDKRNPAWYLLLPCASIFYIEYFPNSGGCLYSIMRSEELIVDASLTSQMIIYNSCHLNRSS